MENNITQITYSLKILAWSRASWTVCCTFPQSAGSPVFWISSLAASRLLWDCIYCPLWPLSSRSQGTGLVGGYEKSCTRSWCWHWLCSFTCLQGISCVGVWCFRDALRECSIPFTAGTRLQLIFPSWCSRNPRIACPCWPVCPCPLCGWSRSWSAADTVTYDLVPFLNVVFPTRAPVTRICGSYLWRPPASSCTCCTATGNGGPDLWGKCLERRWQLIWGTMVAKAISQHSNVFYYELLYFGSIRESSSWLCLSGLFRAWNYLYFIIVQI